MYMQIKKSAAEIWNEFEKCKKYNTSIDLYDNIKKCEDFYIGRQWRGINAPDLPKPVVNVLKRVVSYFIAMLVTDDIGISLEPYAKTKTTFTTEDGDVAEVIKEELDAKVIETETEKTIERCRIKDKSRLVIRDAAVDGDAYMYFYYDDSAEEGNGIKGGVRAEILDATLVMFGNRHSAEVDKQPYILVATPLTLGEVKEEAKRAGLSEDEISQIGENYDSDRYSYRDGEEDELVTVLTKFWKENGTVHAIRTTKDVVIRKEWDTEYTRYPIANMIWEPIRNSYHGMSAILPAIPNQISINQMFALLIHWAKTSSIPTTIFDATKISKWTNKVGQAIGVVGNPNDAIASSFRPADISPQIKNLTEQMIQSTTEFLGANDAALGNVRPDNTSAIVAVQNAAAVPLGIQKLEYYSFVEECVRIIIDIMRVDYGERPINITLDGKTFTGVYDFSSLTNANYNMKVDVGESAYWSELTQLQTTENLFAKGIIKSPSKYLENVPDKYVKHKNKLLKELREEEERALADAMKMQQMQNMNSGSVNAPGVPGMEVM